MKLLFIVHATAWSDKEYKAKDTIQNLIEHVSFDQIIEIIQKRPDIRNRRYLNHSGCILEHNEISPVPFFRETLFGEQATFPVANEITLVGGVFNSTGGGCLNVAFDSLINYQKRTDCGCIITIPIWATYPSREEPSWDIPYQIEQVTKDLAWKLLRSAIPFELQFLDEQLITSSIKPMVRVMITS